MYTVGWVLMLLVNLSAVVLGAALLIPPLDPGAEGFMGKSLTELRAFSPSVADWVWHENKMSIFSLLLLGVVGSSITWNALRRGERWAWYTLIFLVFGYDLVYIGIHAHIGYLFYVPIALALLLPAVGGAALTARGIFIGAKQVRPKP
jgi:hypothetical protein